MALFDRADERLFPALLRAGFAARLRWELSDTFLAEADGALARTSDRAAALLLHVHSDAPALSPTAHHVVVQTAAAPPRFLALAPAPALRPAPALLRLTLHDARPRRTLVSLQPAAPAAPYLALRPAPRLQTALSKHALFHLEILAPTLAKPPCVPAPPPRALLPAQAVAHLLLALGVRVRLRSVHARVLTAPPAAPRPVRQDAPPSLLHAAPPHQLLLSPFLIACPAPRADHLPRALLALHDDAQPDPAALVVARRGEAPAARLALPADAPHVLVQYAEQWGVLHLGAVDEGADGEPAHEHWLMAGPRGRLETRTHRGHWESFSLEFVVQSLHAALAELPRSDVFAEAAAATRAEVREQVARNVARARKEAEEAEGAEGKRRVEGKDRAKGKGLAGKAGTPARGKAEEKAAFDHSAALAGLSDPPKAKSGPEKAAPAKGKSGGKASSKSAAAAKAHEKAAAAAATSALPRNKANRKAAKRNKKKQQAARAGKGSKPAAAKAAPPAASPGVEDSRSEPAEPENNKGKTSSGTNASDTAESSTAVAGKSGPPCAACGRSIEGTYTTALGKNFHPQCFCCGKCRRPMGVGGGQFREQNGIPYCQPCYAAHLAPRCARCSQPIMDTVITAMDKTWHKNCLTCTICGLPLTQTFWLYADKPNEPRCGRCVTGSEDGLGRPRGNGRMVNLPMFGRGGSAPNGTLGGAPPALGSSGRPGQARLLTPVLPATTLR